VCRGKIGFFTVGAFASSLFVTGCMVGPNYQRPEQTVPAGYQHVPSSDAAAPKLAGGVTTQGELNDEYWRMLNDPMLNSLIDRALANNPDLHMAEARIRQARAAGTIGATALWPVFGVGGNYQYRGSSLNAGPKPSQPTFRNNVINGTVGGLGSNAAAAILGGGPFLSTTPPEIPRNAAATAVRGGTSILQNKISEIHAPRDINLFHTGFDASWEADLWGGTRRAIEASGYGLEATIDSLHNLQGSLVGEVARNYVQARGFQKRLGVARENVARQQKAYETTLHLREAGKISDLPIRQAEAQLASTQALIPVYEGNYYQAVHRIGVLLGQTPESLIDEFAKAAPIPTVPPQLPIGLPSSLLSRRADVCQSERLLAQTTADIGVATADLFPQFSITGSFGTDTRNFQHIFDYNSLSWGVGPSIRWPIFDGGRVRANIELQNARAVEAALQYSGTLSVALEEVENALVAYSGEQVRFARLSEAVEANRKAYDIAYSQFSGGLTNFLDLLQVEGALITTEDQMIESETNVVVNFIAVNKALGSGGQTPHVPRPGMDGPIVEWFDWSPVFSVFAKPPEVHLSGPSSDSEQK